MKNSRLNFYKSLGDKTPKVFKTFGVSKRSKPSIYPRFFKCYLAFLFVGIFLSSCKQKTPSKKTSKAIAVQVAEVQNTTLKTYKTFNAKTQYQKQERLRSHVTGYVSRLNFKIGEPIKNGQVFASVQTKEQAALRDAAKIDSSLSKFSHPLIVRSHVDGILKKINVNPNDYVSEGDVLAVIAQPQSLVVQVSVPFDFAEHLKTGTPCTVLVSSDRQINAKITDILPKVDSTTQTQQFLIALPKIDLPENLSVQVKILSEEAKNARVVPKTALQTNALLTKYWVMRVQGDSLAIKTPVKPLMKNDSVVQVEGKHIQPKTKVVTEGSYGMRDSTAIKIAR